MAGAGSSPHAPGGPGAVAGPAVDEVGRAGPAGWRRVLIATALGVVAGALVALLLPRDDGPRRSTSVQRHSVPADEDSGEQITAPPGHEDGSRRP